MPSLIPYLHSSIPRELPCFHLGDPGTRVGQLLPRRPPDQRRCCAQAGKRRAESLALLCVRTEKVRAVNPTSRTEVVCESSSSPPMSSDSMLLLLSDIDRTKTNANRERALEEQIRLSSTVSSFLRTN
jgi:hypothetical protein